MTDDKLAEIERRATHPIQFGAMAQVDRGLLLAEAKRLRADERAMKYAFADRCQDGDMMGQALRLAREEGRLEAIKWSLRGKCPLPREGGWWWAKGQGPASYVLPDEVFDLLEGGEAKAHFFDGGRSYPTLEDAASDYWQALAKLARQGLPVPEEAP